MTTGKAYSSGKYFGVESFLILFMLEIKETLLL